MTEEQLRDWLRDNLVIEAEPESVYGPSNDVRIILRFKDGEPISSCWVCIPES